jgi:hypothetical protein
MSKNRNNEPKHAKKKKELRRRWNAMSREEATIQLQCRRFCVCVADLQQGARRGLKIPGARMTIDDGGRRFIFVRNSHDGDENIIQRQNSFSPPSRVFRCSIGCMPLPFADLESLRRTSLCQL